MITANKTHEKKVIEILVKSFENIYIDNSINFIVGFDANRIRKLERLLKFQFRMSLLFGKVFVNEEFDSVILFIHSKKFNLKRLFLEIQLAINVIGLHNIYRVLKREKVLKSNHNSTDYIHLWLMGTAPYSQGKGRGSTLIKETLHYYSNKTIILETTAPENVKFYEKAGFHVFEENHVLNYPLYFMRYV